MSTDQRGGDADNDLNADEILADGIGYRDKKSPKDQTQLEVAIGDGMEFTIHGKINNISIITILIIICLIKL